MHMEVNNCMVSCDSVKDKVVEFKDNRQQVCRIYCNIHFIILSHFSVPNLSIVGTNNGQFPTNFLPYHLVITSVYFHHFKIKYS